MKVGIVSWTGNIASMNIRQHLLATEIFKDTSKNYHGNPVLHALIGENEVELYQVEDCLEANYLDELNKDLIVFITTHKSQAGIPSLCVHTPGNWGRAELGGRDRQLSSAPANFLKAMFNQLHGQAQGSNYDVVQEVTHHGPSIMTPCAYVEIGSAEPQWKDEKIGKLVAESLVKVLSNPVKEYPSVIGIGGLHTCPNFTKVILGEDYALGHACAKYALADLNREMLLQAFDRTVPRPQKVILAWKGLGTERARIVGILDENSIGYVKIR